ncbi:MAG: GNAT family N-acetyltransferase [Vicinamibacteria bacterium]
MQIREYDAARDREAVRNCYIQLQDFERSLDPRLPPGERIADASLEEMFTHCREFDGSVLVAEWNGEVVGFVAVWTRYRSLEPEDDPTVHAYVSDLVVSSSHRRRGIGRALLEAAEEKARAARCPYVRLSVKAGNQGAISLYAEAGFREWELYLEKRLT